MGEMVLGNLSGEGDAEEAGFDLKRKHADEEVSSKLRRAAKGTSTRLQSPKGKDTCLNILLVDHDASSRVLIGAMIADGCFASSRVTRVGSFAETVSESRRADYSVILVDLNLRDVFGIDLLHRTRSLFPHIPIIVISGASSEEEVDALIREGAEDFLEKSRITPELLRRSIRYSLDRRETQERLRHSAYFDSLTGLANRRNFYDFSEEIFSVERSPRAALVLVDLDHFKDINDALGHSAGDELLIEISKRLKVATRDRDMVARLGGDEFALILTGLQSAHEANEIVEGILRDVSEPVKVAGRELRVTSSMGIALYPDHGWDVETLLRNADLAMYSTKSAGRNGVRAYVSTMHSQISERAHSAQELRVALEKREFVLHYQPQVNTHNKRPYGLESLIRWQHPTRGLLGPDQFVPLLEELGLIKDVGDWIFEESFKTVQLMRRIGWPDMKIAVNVSASQLGHHDIVTKLMSLLEKYEVPGDAIELEITETVFIRDLASAHRVLTELQGLGFGIALDDFGTGFSSLSYLTQLPINILKIDRSFINRIGTSDERVARAMIQLAHSLELTVVAEGVENHSQHDYLLGKSCDRCQGYLYARPMAMERLREWLIKRSKR